MPLLESELAVPLVLAVLPPVLVVLVLVMLAVLVVAALLEDASAVALEATPQTDAPEGPFPALVAADMERLLAVIADRL